MNDRKQVNLGRINDLWQLHEHLNEASEGRCLAFAIDSRYLEREGLQWRVGVSFGDNVVTPEPEQGFLGIPVHPGEFIFGLHVLASNGDKLSLYDKWMDTRAAGDCKDPEEGEKMARSILASMSDADFLASVRESEDEKGPLKVSSLHLLEDFEVVDAEAW